MRTTIQIDDELLALHYNVDFGINLLGDAKRIYIIPLLGLILLFINFILLVNFNHTQEKSFIAHILLSTALLTNLTLLASAGTLYLINFR